MSRRRAIAIVALAVALGAPAGTFARPAGSVRQARSAGSVALDQSQRIDVNRISMVVTNFGSFAFDATFGQAGLEFPRGANKTAVFAGGLWLGGRINGVTKVGVTSYANEWFPGPILPSGLPSNPNAPEHKVYKLSRVYANSTDRDAALADYNVGAVPHGADPVTVQPDGSLDIPGDQVTWSVYNEADSVAKATSGEDIGHTGPIGIEVQQTVFAFDRPGALGQTVFMRFRMINKGGNRLDSAYVSMWMDPDLGGFTDDLVGCDVPRSMALVYNADNDDDFYGQEPPALGCAFLRGPRGYGGYDLGVTAFAKLSGEAGGDPDHFSQVYNFMRGLRRDGDPVVDPTNGQVTTFMHGGDPVTGSGWLDQSPSDRRLLLTSGPFEMAAGDTQEVVVGLVIGDARDRLASITLLRFYHGFVRTAFAQDFDLADPPSPPVVTATPTERSAILTWDQASEVDRPLYPWEGYVVYQGQSRSGPWKRVATLDRVNHITSVAEREFDVESGLLIDRVRVVGTNQGVAYKHVATTDAWRGGPLRVGTPYYFAVTSYAVGLGQTPQVLESDIRYDPDPSATTVHAVIPQTPVAGVDLASAGIVSGPTRGQRVPGMGVLGTDTVTVDVIDPMRLLNATYQVGYRPDEAGVLGWYVVRVVGAAVDTVVSPQANFAGGEALPVFDGLQVRVTGRPPGELMSVTYQDVGPHGPAYVGFGGNLGLGFFDGSADYAYNTGNVLAGLRSKLVPWDGSQFTPVELRLTGGPAGQKAYLYRQSAGAPRTYPYAGYVDVPFTVWDLAQDRQLNCGLFEWDAAAPNAAWDPDVLPDPLARREFLYVFQSPYSGATPDPFYTTLYPNARTYANELDFMYVLWCAQAQDVGGAAIPADAGDVVRFELSSRTTNDIVTFVTRAAERNSVGAARSELARIRAVPNPYLGHSRYELSASSRVVKFTHLPARCTIRIFTLAGDPVRTLEKDDEATSQLTWDLRNARGRVVTSGVYLFHVDAPGFGAHVGKLAVFMER